MGCRGREGEGKWTYFRKARGGHLSVLVMNEKNVLRFEVRMDKMLVVQNCTNSSSSAHRVKLGSRESQSRTESAMEEGAGVQFI